MAKILDNVRNQKFDETVVRECPNPHYIDKFHGKDGKCFVSIYTCMRCKYRKTFSGHGGLACGYAESVEGENNVSQGAKEKS